MISFGLNGEWNFGPSINEKRTVIEVIEKVSAKTGQKEPIWETNEVRHPHEANFLLLNSEKARSLLKWKEALDFDAAVDWTVNWITSKETELNKMIKQLDQFLKIKDNK
jgi:nucleoside-diphosphate-sugar epimerase